MATETISSDHSTNTTEVKEEVNGEVKTIEKECAAPAKEIGHEAKPKAKDSPTPSVVAESEEKIEHKQMEHPATEEVKKTDNEEKSEVVEDLPSPIVPLAEPEEKVEDKEIEPPVAEEVKTSDEEEKAKSDEMTNPVVPCVDPEEKIELKEVEAIVTEEIKKTDEEVEVKPEDSPSPVVPLAEPEKKIEDKKVEPLVVEEVERGIEEEPKVEDSQCPVVPLAESEAKVEDKKIELPEEKEELKVEDSPTPEVPCAEPEEKIEDKKIEFPVVEEVKKAEEKEEPKLEELPSPAVPSAEPEEETKDKKVELLVAEEVKKTEEKEPKAEVSPTPAVLVAVSEEKIEDKEAEPAVIEAVEKTVEDEKTKDKDSPDPAVTLARSEETTENKEVEPPVTGKQEEMVSAEKQQTEPPKMVEVLESSVEAIEKDQVQDLPFKESEPAAVLKGYVEKTDAECKKAEETPEPVSALPEKPQVQSEVPSQIEKESAAVESKECLEVEPVKNEEEVTKEEPPLTEIVCQAKEEPVELTQTEAKEVEDVNSSIPTTLLTEKPLEGKNTSWGIDLVAENGKEDVKDEAVSSAKKNGDGVVKEVGDEVTSTIKEPVEELQKELKGEETKEKEADDIAKPDVPIVDSTKDSALTETVQDPPKEQVSAKSTQKQSNTIIGKVKQTLVKAKKAIIGKSSNSKTPPTEAKRNDVKAENVVS